MWAWGCVLRWCAGVWIVGAGIAAGLGPRNRKRLRGRWGEVELFVFRGEPSPRPSPGVPGEGERRGGARGVRVAFRRRRFVRWRGGACLGRRRRVGRG